MKIFVYLLLFLIPASSIWGCNDGALPESITDNIEHPITNGGILSVIDYGIKNDGSLIGSQLNQLIKQSYGKTGI